MQKLEFAEALDLILTKDTRYDREAYYFLRDALEFTMKVRKKAKGCSGHVTGQQLLEGVRQFAIKEFGPMVPTVFEYWRLKRGEDFGHMVFNLIDVGIFGKTETDCIDDFKGGYTFQEAFVLPYQPAKLPAHHRIASGEVASELH
jgi:uncharacterized repeat protein (TIGR04138 family)